GLCYPGKIWLGSVDRPRRFYRGIFESADDFGIVGACKVRSVIGIARSFIRCRLWIRTERASHGYAFLRLIIDELGCDELVRRCAFFHPLLQRQAERSEEHTSELQSRENLVCRLLLEKK